MPKRHPEHKKAAFQCRYKMQKDLTTRMGLEPTIFANHSLGVLRSRKATPYH
ncbi:hypothetical protein BKA80DRAFT_262395 [Phyllosticta citrichinensis]